MADQSVKKALWPGEMVSKETMLAYIRKYFAGDMLKGKMNFAHTYPGYVRDVEKLFTVRFCRFDHLPVPVRIQAAYDGVLSWREYEEGDWFIGSYNSGSFLADSHCLEYGGLSVIFFLHHIRLHYCHFDHGKELTNIYYHIPGPPDGILMHTAESLDILIHENSSCRRERCRLLLEILREQLCYALEKNSVCNQSPRSVSLRIKGYLEHNFTSDINCSCVCDALEINRSYASTVFKEDFGVSMMDYLLKLRIDAAKHLLLSKHKLKIQEVARFCAFNDTGYFIRVFRKQTGMTPGAFRK